MNKHFTALVEDIHALSPAEAFQLTTQLIDEVQQELQPRLAGLRRGLVASMRSALIGEGMSATDAEIEVARITRMSASTVRRMFAERGLYTRE